MKLMHLQDKNGITYLYLCLNQQENNSYGLKSQNVPPEEAEIIKKNVPRLRSSDKPYHISWLKTNAPISYQKAYRELDLSNYTILQIYEI